LPPPSLPGGVWGWGGTRDCHESTKRQPPLNPPLQGGEVFPLRCSVYVAAFTVLRCLVASAMLHVAWLLVLCYTSKDGYSFFKGIGASSVVAGRARLLPCQALAIDTPYGSLGGSPSRRLRRNCHAPDGSDNPSRNVRQSRGSTPHNENLFADH
jgi:hypothetical protein